MFIKITDYIKRGYKNLNKRSKQNELLFSVNNFELEFEITKL